MPHAEKPQPRSVAENPRNAPGEQEILQRNARSCDQDRQLLFSVDGSMMNRTLLRSEVSDHLFIGRVREDAALYAPVNTQ